MRHRPLLAELLAEVLREDIRYENLRQVLLTYQQSLTEFTQLNIDDAGNRDDLALSTGYALSPAFAALCVSDIIRTRQFIRGVYFAVRDVVRQRGTAHLCYAGTGPFASLVLPVLTAFSPDELQITGLEVNEGTIRFLRKLLPLLEVEPYFIGLTQVDATSYKFPPDQQVDILLSETMQQALVKEQQVPIVFNLLPQCGPATILLPAAIKIDLALFNPSSFSDVNSDPEEHYVQVLPLFTLDRDFALQHAAQWQSNSLGYTIPLLNGYLVAVPDGSKHDHLVVLTSIRVYGDEWIDWSASGLTVPKVLASVQVGADSPQQITLTYVLDEHPHYVCSVSENVS